MKKSIFVTLSLLLIAGIAQARGGSTPSLDNIYCMGDKIVINMEKSTISSSVLGFRDVPVKMTKTQQDNGVLTLIAKARGLHLVSMPAESSGWSGDQNTTLTVGNKVVTTECTIN